MMKMSKLGKFGYVVFQMIHWAVAGVYTWFIFLIMSKSGVGYDTLLSMGDWERWNWANIKSCKNINAK